MPRVKLSPKSKLLQDLLGKTSWLVSHAIALSDQAKDDEAEVEWLRAAESEGDVACWLEAEGQELEAAVHHVSAASCFAEIQRYTQAVAHLRSALSFSLRPSYRREIEGLLKNWLSKAKKQLRKQTAAVA